MNRIEKIINDYHNNTGHGRRPSEIGLARIGCLCREFSNELTGSWELANTMQALFVGGIMAIADGTGQDIELLAEVAIRQLELSISLLAVKRLAADALKRVPADTPSNVLDALSQLSKLSAA